MTQARPPRRLGSRPALDGLRALAVMLVIGIHVGLLSAGYIGVDVFLPLSGFLITVLLCEEWDRRGTISLRRFYERRAGRLLPALVLLVGAFSAVTVALRPFDDKLPLQTLDASTLLFANNWVSSLAPAHGSLLGALSPTWTLAQEVQFYLLWPPMLWLLLRRGTPARAVIVLVGAAIAVLIGTGTLLAHLDPNYNSYTSPFERSAELLFGAVAAIAWRERLVPAMLRRRPMGWLLAGGIGYLVAAGKPSTPLWYLTAAALSALLVIHLVDTDRPGLDTRRRGLDPDRPGLLRCVLSARPLAYVGRISYGIYLFHVPIYYLLWRYAPAGRPAVYWPVVTAISILVAAASWELVESPIRRAVRRGLLRPAPVPAPAPRLPFRPAPAPAALPLRPAPAPAASAASGR